MNNMLSLEEVKNFLEVDQTALEKYLKEGKLHAYKIGGTYLRFRKEDVMHLRFEILPKKRKPAAGDSFFGRIRDFWHFNNFYIISVLLVLFLVLLVFKF